MDFVVDDASLSIYPEMVVVAGFTGRDASSVVAHMRELEREGISCPATVPNFYELPPEAATQQPSISVLGTESSGEAELALVVDGERRYLTLASDHTDRAVEKIDIGLSKRVCPKVFAREMWPIASVEGHLDQLELRSWITEDGDETLYQHGLAAALLPPLELLDRLTFEQPLSQLMMLCGTVDTIGRIRHSERFKASITDPVRGSSITLSYDIAVVPPLRSEPTVRTASSARGWSQ